MKKTLSLLLAGCLALACAAPEEAPEEAPVTADAVAEARLPEVRYYVIADT